MLFAVFWELRHFMKFFGIIIILFSMILTVLLQEIDLKDMNDKATISEYQSIGLILGYMIDVIKVSAGDPGRLIEQVPNLAAHD